MHRSFKVHFRLVVLGWLRKSEGCNIGLLRLREVLSRESNTSEDLIFFVPISRWLACLWQPYLGVTSAKLTSNISLCYAQQIIRRHLRCQINLSWSCLQIISPCGCEKFFIRFALGLRSGEEIGRLQHWVAKTAGGALS